MQDAKSDRLTFPFFAVVAARLTSCFGSFLSMMALNVYMLELTDSATWMGLTLAVKVFSGIAATPFIGNAVDRMNRKSLMIASDLILAAGMLALVFMPAALLKAYIVFLMVLLGIFSNLFEVALSAATPVILDNRDTMRANSWLVGGRNMVIALSGLCAAAAGFLFKGYNAIFVIDALTYVFSASVLLALKIKTAEARSPRSEAGILEQLRSGFAEVRRLPNAGAMALILGFLLLDAFASASHNVGWPVFSKALRPDHPMYFYGFILFFWALGNLAGIYQLNRSPRLNRLRPETLYLVFLGIMSSGMILTFQSRIPWLIALAAFIAGVGDGTYMTFGTTYLQQAPDAVRGKLFALSGLALRTGFSIGFVAVPLALQVLDAGATALFFHGIVLAAIAAYFMFPKAFSFFHPGSLGARGPGSDGSFDPA
jgi:MFS family permease